MHKACLFVITILLLHYYTDWIALSPNSLKWTVLGSKGSLPPPHHQGQLRAVPPCDWIAFRQFISLKMFTSPFPFGAPWRLTLVAIVMFQTPWPLGLTCHLLRNKNTSTSSRIHALVSTLTSNTNEEIRFRNNGENQTLKCLHNELFYLATSPS